MKDTIPEFLQEKINLQGYAKTDKFPEDIKRFMVDYANHYDWGISNLTIIFKLLKSGISELGNCAYKNCQNKKTIIWDGTITDGCCKNHTTKIVKLRKYGVEHHLQLEENKKYGENNIFSNKEFIQQKFKEKYGGVNPNQVAEIQEKIKHTNLKKYGCEWNLASSYSREKQAKTNLEKYGVENYATSTEFKSRKQEIETKQKQTFLEKYGTEHPMQSEQCKIKSKETFFTNYGVSHATKIPETIEKKKKTMKDKFGVEHYSQDPNNYEKVVKSMYVSKEYIWKTGEVSLVQGNEPIVLRELEEKGYTYEMVLTGATAMPEIWYDFEDSTHRYFPDIFIPNENLLIEVKSPWTVTLNVEKNQAKFSAVKNAGFDFKLEVR